MKKFGTDIILTIINDKVLTKNLEIAYDLAKYMTGRKEILKHELHQVLSECSPHLLKQHPKLKDINVDEVNEENWEEWYRSVVEVYGAELPVRPIWGTSQG